MARYVNDLKVPISVEGKLTEVENYLTSEGFKQAKYKGSPVWKKGLGLMLGPQYVHLTSKEGSIHLEAWIKLALFPGVYLGEMGIEGVFGMIPKKKLKKRVLEIEERIKKGEASEPTT